LQRYQDQDREPPQPGESSGDSLPNSDDPTGAWPLTVAAWILILLTAAATIAANMTMSAGGEDSGDESVVLTLMRIQGQYLVGAADMPLLARPMVFGQARDLLASGTASQRQRGVILAGELGGPREARGLLVELERLMERPPRGPPPTLSPRQQAVQEALHHLYPPALEHLGDADARTLAAEAADDIAGDRRALMVEELGWFGRLALAPAGTDDAAARKDVLASARSVALALLGAAGLGILAGLIGCGILTVMAVLAAMRRLRSGFGRPRRHQGIYAETFALWMVLFLVLQVGAGALSPPGWEMLAVIVAFFVSLGTLAWPVRRGIPWRQVRREIGLEAGPAPWVEPLVGLGGYVATIPLMMVGIMITVGLMALQGILAGGGDTFAPTGLPAHPIVIELSGDSLWPKLQLLALAAIVAPVVEETMFRGVLYRHLRGATSRLGVLWSIVLSTGAAAFIFAAIHPQGWVAIPALMSLACGMTLVREWRGTLIPSMVLHGLSNGLVMVMLLVVLSL
jgi:membrane protease YdiL (CAAX protease family)